MATLTVLGAGMMASALCVPLVDAGHTVRLVGTHLDRTIIDDLTAGRPHTTLKLALPESIQPCHVERLAEALDGADGLVIGVSSAGARWAGERLAEHLPAPLPIVAITKGLALTAGRPTLLPDLMAGLAGREGVEIGCIVGPCIAGELARRADTCIILTGRNAAHLSQLKAWLQTPYYHVRTSPDLVGNELCAALKNAYALAIGFAAGLHEQRGGTPGSVAAHNFEAAVFGQAICEMQRVVVALGGGHGTVLGLPGAGDLMVTCNGGRTGRFGRWLGLGLPLDEAIARMEGATLEAVEILTTLHEASDALAEAGAPIPSLPLLAHLIDVVVHGHPVRMPFEAFDFGMQP